MKITWRNTRNAGPLLAGIAMLASCANLPAPPTTPQVRYEYALSIAVKPGDTAATLEHRYAGRVLAWHPESSFAILGTDTAPAQSDAAVTALSVNRDAQNAPELMLERTTVGLTPASATRTEGWTAWSGGWTAWSGGWTAWSGGWTAWGGGTTTVPTLPSDNRTRFLQIKVPQGQALSRQFGSGIKVAVIDTGLDLAHPMFTGRLAPSSEWKDFIDGDANPQEIQPASGTSAYGHGTAVAGLILQVAPKATILPIRVLGPDGSGDTTNVVSAIDWAIQKGAKVINLSLGTTVNDTVLQNEVNYATSLGIYIVASAGNTGDTNVTYPAGWAKSGSNAKYLLSVGLINVQLLRDRARVRGPRRIRLQRRPEQQDGLRLGHVVRRASGGGHGGLGALGHGCIELGQHRIVPVSVRPIGFRLRPGQPDGPDAETA
jgi:thermitase